MENHFDHYRGNIKQILMTSRFKKDAGDFDTSLITESEHNVRLHKFEKHVNGNVIFRAIVNEVHYVYAITPEHRLIFLRVFKNFKKYGHFLEDDRAIIKEIELGQIHIAI